MKVFEQQLRDIFKPAENKEQSSLFSILSKDFSFKLKRISCSLNESIEKVYPSSKILFKKLSGKI